MWEGYNAFYERVGPTALPLEISEATWARFFDWYEPVRCLVAERHGELVGLAHYIFHRNTTTVAPVCYLQDLFTSPAARAGGVGRALIESVYEKSREAGSPRFYWHTHESNAIARRLYDKLASRSGFIVYRRDV